MSSRILITSGQVINTDGPHQTLIEALRKAGIEVICSVGPHSEQQFLRVIADRGPFVGCHLGGDRMTDAVLDKLIPDCKVLSADGVGVAAYNERGCLERDIALVNTPGINSQTVACSAMALMSAAFIRIDKHAAKIRQGLWSPDMITEPTGLTAGIIGFGHIGQILAAQLLGLGMNVIVHTRSWDQTKLKWIRSLSEQCDSLFASMPVRRFAPAFSDSRNALADSFAAVFQGPLFQERSPSIKRVGIDDLWPQANVIFPLLTLTPQTVNFIDKRVLAHCKRGVVVVNVDRAAVVDDSAMLQALQSGQVAAYCSDVYPVEPISEVYSLIAHPNFLGMPHIAGRSARNVGRQSTLGLLNLCTVLGKAKVLPQLAGVEPSNWIVKPTWA